MHFAHVITLTSCGSRCLSAHCIPSMMSSMMSFVVSSCLSLSLVSLPFLLCFFHCLVLFSVRHTIFNVVTAEGTIAFTRNEEYCPLAIYNPLKCYEPKLLDIFDYSEISAVIFQNESVDVDTEPSYSCDAELDDEFIGKALSSPLFIQEREEPANLGQVYHSHEESLFFILTETLFANRVSQRYWMRNIQHQSNMQLNSRTISEVDIVVVWLWVALLCGSDVADP